MTDMPDFPALVELASRLQDKDKKTCDLALYTLKKQDERLAKRDARIAELERELACSIVSGNDAREQALGYVYELNAAAKRIAALESK